MSSPFCPSAKLPNNRIFITFSQNNNFFSPSYVDLVLGFICPGQSTTEKTGKSQNNLLSLPLPCSYLYRCVLLFPYLSLFLTCPTTYRTFILSLICLLPLLFVVVGSLFVLCSVVFWSDEEDERGCVCGVYTFWCVWGSDG